MLLVTTTQSFLLPQRLKKPMPWMLDNLSYHLTNGKRLLSAQSARRKVTLLLIVRTGSANPERIVNPERIGTVIVEVVRGGVQYIALQ